MTLILSELSLYDINRIRAEVETLPAFSKKGQLSLQTVEGCTDPHFGTDKLEFINRQEEEFVIPLFDIPYINGIITEHKLFRTRLMMMTQKSCLSYHYDLTKRKHIPIVTNKNCFFVVDDTVVRMPEEGRMYELDTLRIHTAINASFENRLHMVGCFLD